MRKTARIAAVHEPVAVVVAAVSAHFRRGNQTQALGAEDAIWIGTVDHSVAVVVHSISAQFDSAPTGAGGMSRAVVIFAVDIPIAVVVRSIFAFFRDAPANHGPDTIGVVAVDAPITILIDATVAQLAGRLGGASADSPILALWVKAIRHSIAVVVRAVGALFAQTRMGERVLVVAVGAAAKVINETIVIPVAGGACALSEDAPWDQTGICARALLVAYTGGELTARTTDRTATRAPAASPLTSDPRASTAPIPGCHD